jgi:hypothetical protein
VKRIWRYLSATKDLGITYSPSPTRQSLDLQAYSDSDFGCDVDTKRSTTSFVLKINGSPFAWKASKQSTTSLSSTESEIHSLVSATQHVLYLRDFLLELGFAQLRPTIIWSDSQSAISSANRSGFQHRLKHVSIKQAFLRQHLQEQAISIQYIPSDQLFCDLMNKPVPISRFITLRNSLGIT